MKCDYLKDSRCTLRLYGGYPSPANCIACVSQGNNNAEFARKLFDSRARTHPVHVQRISGCCDSAENPPL